MYEREQQKLTSILGEARNGIHLWLPFLKPEEVQKLVNAAEVIKESKVLAIERQKQKLA